MWYASICWGLMCIKNTILREKVIIDITIDRKKKYQIAYRQGDSD